MSSSIEQSPRRATRVLFAASLLFVPMPFSMLFVVGLVPLSCAATFFLRTLTGTSSGSVASDPLLVPLMLAVHLLVDGGLLYLIWRAVCRLLFAHCRRRVAISAVVLLLSGQAIASFFPVYVIAGEHDTTVMPLWRVWRELVVGER